MAVKKMTVEELERVRGKKTVKNKMTQHELDEMRRQNAVVNIPLTTKNGKNFGNISYNAYKAIENNRLDSYKAINEEEQKALNAYKQYNNNFLTDLIMSDGSTAGKITKGGLDAIENNSLNSYVPKNETEKNTIEKYKQMSNYVEPENLKKGNGVGRNLQYAGEQAAWSFSGAIKNIGNAFLDFFSMAMNQTKYDGTMLAAESWGALPEGYSDEYGKIVDKQTEAITANIKKSAEEHAKEGAIIDLEYPDLSDTARTVGKVVGGTAQMVPMIATSFINPLLGSMIFGSQVYGGSLSEALADGADIQQARVYGGAEAIKEVTIERIFGGLPFTKGVTDKWIKPITNKVFTSRVIKGLAKMGVNALGEGVEEGVADIVSPYIKRAVYDKNAPNATWEELSLAFMSGVVPSLLLGAGANVSSVRSYKGLNTKIDEYNESINFLPESVRPSYLDKKTTTAEEYNSAVEQLFIRSRRVNINAEKDAALAGIQFLKGELLNVEKSGVASKEKLNLINGYTTQINAFEDYINDLEAQMKDLALFEAGKGNADLINQYNTEPISFKELNPTHIDVAVGANNEKGYVNIKPLSNDKYIVTNAYGEEVIKSSNEIKQRYIDATKDESTQKLIKNLINGETVKIQRTDDKSYAESSVNNIIRRGDVNDASNDIKALDGALAQDGVAEAVRKSIIKSATDLESYLSDGDKTVMQAAKSVNLYTKRLSNELREIFKITPDYWKMYETNLKLLSTPHAVIDEGFVESYSEIFADAIKANNSLAYTALSEDGNDAGKVLADYILSGTVPENMTNVNELRVTAERFKSFIASAVFESVQVYNQLYGTNEALTTQVNAIDSGDYSVIAAQKETADNKLDGAKTTTVEQNTGQIIEDYSQTVDDILMIDDESALLLDKRGTLVKVMETTPDVILNNVNVAENYPIVFIYRKLYCAIRKNGIFKENYHALGRDIALKLPYYLNSPDLVLRTDDNRINVLAEIETAKGNNGIIAVELSATKNVDNSFKKYNIVVTMFSSDDKYVENLLSKKGNKVEYIKKDLLQVNPQRHKWLSIINNKSYHDNSISRDETIVNNKDMQDSGDYSVIAAQKETASNKNVRFAVSDDVTTSDKNNIGQVSERLEVSTEGLSDLMKNKNLARKIFVKYAKENFPKTVINLETNKEIGISRTGIDKFLSGNFSKEKYATGFKIPELIQSAYKIGEAENRKNKSGISGYEYYQSPVKVDGSSYIAHIRVRNTDMGEKYYGHTVSRDVFDIKIESVAWNSEDKSTVHSINASDSDNSISRNETIVNNKDMQDSGEYSSNKANEVRFSLDNEENNDIFRAKKEVLEKFSGQIDAWLSGELKSSDQFELGQTPEVLRRLGAKALPVVMSQDVLAKITGAKHSISLDEIKKLPSSIAEPIMVFKSNTVPNAFVILTELTDKKGNDVVAALHLNKYQDRIKINRIASVYGKDSIINFVEQQIKNGNLRYIDKNKSQNWSASRGLQLPKLVQSNPDNNIILQKDDIVNNKDMQDNAKYSIEREENNNERRNGILHDDMGRRDDASARKQGRRVSENAGRDEGLSAEVRAEYVTRLRERGQIERSEVFGWDIECDFIKEEAYNDDMKAIVRANKEIGIEITRFFVGTGDNLRNRLAKFWGVILGKKQVLISYDNPEFAPQLLNEHEKTHRDYHTERVQKLKKIIFNNLSEFEKEKILSLPRYKQYLKLYRIKEDVWEEFICDVVAGMTTYSIKFERLVADYHNGNELIDYYSPAVYNKIMDSGGNAMRKGGTENETNTDNRRRTERISEVDGDSGRGNKGHSQNIPGRTAEGKTQAADSDESSEMRYPKGGSAASVGILSESTHAETGADRKKSDKKRFLEAIEAGDEETARILLNKRAKKNGYVPVNVYHGTRADSVFTEFQGKGAYWVSTDLEYAKSYVDNYLTDEARADELYTEPDSGVYDLYIRRKKVLDVGNIEKTVTDFRDVEEFAEKTGFDGADLWHCWAVGRSYGGDQIWTITMTEEFADLAREHGYDTIRATEGSGIVTYGVLYPENIKSAKTVTYDDDGKIIPLNKRFDKEEKDIRWNVESDGKEQKNKIGEVDTDERSNQTQGLGLLGADRPKGNLRRNEKLSEYFGRTYGETYSQRYEESEGRIYEKSEGKENEIKLDAGEEYEDERSNQTKGLGIQRRGGGMDKPDESAGRLFEYFRSTYEKASERIYEKNEGKEQKLIISSMGVLAEFVEILEENYTDEMRKIAKDNSAIGIKTVFTIEDVLLNMPNGEHKNSLACTADDIIFINANADTSLTDIATHERIHYAIRKIAENAGVDKENIAPRLLSEIKQITKTDEYDRIYEIVFEHATLHYRAPSAFTIADEFCAEIGYLIRYPESEAWFTDYDAAVKLFDDLLTLEPENQTWLNFEGENRNSVRFSLDDDGEYDWVDRWQELIDKYKAMPKGEKPARDIDVPNKIANNRPVSQFARTMMEAGVTPDFAISEFEQRILDGTMTHEVITNKKAQNYATGKIKELGFEGARNRWHELAEENKVGKKELCLGMELYNQAVNNKDVKTAMQIAAELVANATRAGQTLQATRMLKMMSPDGQLYYLEKSVQKLNEEFKEKLGKKYKEIKMSDELMEEFLYAEGEEAKNKAYDKLCQNIADQIPATKRDKWNSWRYLAMLGNTRTHLRNILGNAAFVPAIRMKNYVGAIIERTAGIKSEDRTKSFIKDKKALEFAKKDYYEMEKVIKGVNAKYAVTDDIESKRRIFNTRILEKLRTANFKFLEAEDGWFLKMHYIDALSRLITVRKLDVENMSQEALDKARFIAIKEAQAATYRDANAVADALNKLQRQFDGSEHKALRALGAMVEGVMPFKKTPLNIAKQGVLYSPGGIMTGVYKGLKRLKNGDAFSAADVIDDLAKGLTGTGIILLGMLLARLGFLSGGKDENKKKRNFDSMTGEQNYAINVGGKSYTIDWMAPLSLPLFIGVELNKLTQEEGLGFAQVTQAVSTLAEPLLEMSVFKGINDLLETAQYGEAQAVFAIIEEMVTSYATQALPTIGGQLSRIADGTKRDYYFIDKNKNVPRSLQSLWGQIASKIPFMSYLFEPSVDSWGREETYGGVLERIAENTLSPGYYSEEDYTRVDKELKKLYERTGESRVFPIEQQEYYTESGKQYNMSAEHAAKAKKIRGKKSFELVKKLIASSEYRHMTDEEKVKAVAKCYEEAGKYTKEKMLTSVKRAAG